MAAALVQVCVDPRLNHELIRIQVRQKLARMNLAADRIFILNETEESPGSSFRNTVKLLTIHHEPIVLCAVLDHDDCQAGKAGLRPPLERSAEQITAYLAKQSVRCPVVTGNIRTEHNHVLWSDEPQPRYVPFSFGLH